MAANATFALKPGVWFLRVRFVIFAPDSRREPSPPSGRKSTQPTVQILEASSCRVPFGDLSDAWRPCSAIVRTRDRNRSDAREAVPQIAETILSSRNWHSSGSRDAALVRRRSVG